jgi:hypothetical protein
MEDRWEFDAHLGVLFAVGFGLVFVVADELLALDVVTEGIVEAAEPVAEQRHAAELLPAGACDVDVAASDVGTRAAPEQAGCS